MAEYFRDLVSGGLPNPDPYHRAQGHLNVGDILFSATRNFKLTLQADGNLVQYVIDDSTLPPDITQGQYPQAIWSSGTKGWGAVRLTMQADGDLVLYTAGNAPVWHTDTQAFPGAFLRCQDDGNLVLLATDGRVLSATNIYAS